MGYYGALGGRGQGCGGDSGDPEKAAWIRWDKELVQSVRATPRLNPAPDDDAGLPVVLPPRCVPVERPAPDASAREGRPVVRAAGNAAEKSRIPGSVRAERVSPSYSH